LFFEPQPTPYDLHFMVGNVPVRVHPLFWVVTVLLGTSGGTQPVNVGLWLVAVFVSILVHELGHDLAFRYYGIHSHVVLHAMGGLAVPDTMYSGRGQTRSWFSDVVIAFAGPAAGFLLAALICAALYASGGGVGFPKDELLPIPQPLFPNRPNVYAWLLVFRFLEINILWGFLNLLPIFPLDGGQISAAILRKANPHDGMRQALMLSIGTAIGMALLVFVKLDDKFMGIFFAFMAYNSYQILQAVGGGRGGWR
jgi:stage IV sporulation protein FB